jgi:hypothetical protein
VRGKGGSEAWIFVWDYTADEAVVGFRDVAADLVSAAEGEEGGWVMAWGKAICEGCGGERFYIQFDGGNGHIGLEYRCADEKCDLMWEDPFGGSGRKGEDE